MTLGAAAARSHSFQSSKCCSSCIVTLESCTSKLNQRAGYDSDITTSYPVSGKFTDHQRGVYEAVLDAHASVLAAMKPGVSWPVRHQSIDCWLALLQHCQQQV